ncbi:hypothetical protein ASPVEDRAFT_83401 [Aspergillus versicolor CBS 583.65]|uniref:Uncharacterized protein n=1 Tax=Aspergillus versicolor CBS 583.65 TaxID=1036611 RepID=A0A1L9PK23_ASPVE|nr:uncharacterized protein ASPVEDRAFT_83401 [Aspergillus versicolor CBS 583.65]OJJ01877.1 hypothetical protein ASPVEDRAFT_83401 [Aspergillus versicolor CBS 583.65]
MFETVVKDIAKLWSLCPSIRMTVQAEDPDSFTFIASSTCGLGTVNLDSVSSDIVSGGFLGTLVGIYATSNGGQGGTPSYWTRWSYSSVAQEIYDGEVVPTLNRNT